MATVCSTRLFLLGIVIAGLSFAAAAEPGAAKLVIYPAPDGEKASDDYTVEVNEKPVFVYSVGTLNGGPASFGYFDLEGSVKVTVTSRRKVASAKVLPTSWDIQPTVNGEAISFSLPQPRNVTIEINGSYERALHLFANPLEIDAPKPDDPDVLYFGPGVHDLPPTMLKDNQTVYLAGGAIVRPRLQANEKPVQEKNWAGSKVYKNLLEAHGKKNIRIRGRGILDMGQLPWHARTTIVLANCSDCLVEGLIILDTPAWGVGLFGSKKITVTNVKQICKRENSDGIDVCNSQDVLVEKCFLRNNDDEVCVKATSPAPAQETKNVLVKECVIWNERARGLGITSETRTNISDCLFTDCDIIHDLSGGGDCCSLAILVSDSGTMSNIRFENIRIEDVKSTFINIWIGADMWGNDKTRGRVKGVVYKNITVQTKNFPASRITGFDAEHLVEDVTFDNVRINGKQVSSKEAGRIHCNQHTRDIKFVIDTTPPTEAPEVMEAKTAAGNPHVTLAWKPVPDPESSVDRYAVYRDGKKVAEPANCSFRDADLAEETAYTYAVAAVNGANLEGPKSKPAEVKTLADTAAPQLIAVDVDDAQHLKARFSEPVEREAAEDLAHYAVDQGIKVEAATMEQDGKTVLLTVSRLVAGTNYTLGAKAVNDRARKPNVIADGTAQKFTYTPGLVGHWTFDEGKGAQAADASPSGQNARLINLDAQKAWVAGKKGGALAFDGEQGYVEVPDSAQLRDVQAGSYTLVLWFKPADRPPGQGDAYNAQYALISKIGYHEGLVYTHEGRFGLTHWLTGDKGAGTQSAGAYDPGMFHHVAGVVDRAKGRMAIYVGGRLDGEIAFEANAEARPYGEIPWRIGTGNTNQRERYAWPAKGVIDDVRIYNRALDEEEIKRLAE